MAWWRGWLLLAALAVLGCAPAEAATLYINELVNGVSTVGTTLPQVPPQPSIANQIVGLSGSSALSGAFNSRTRVVSLICDEGCSISIGASPTATTSNYLLQQGVQVSFGVNPGDKVAAIANAAGNTGGGGGGGGTSSSFSAAFPAMGTAAGFENSVSGNMVPGIIDNATGGVNVNIVGGGGSGGTSSSFAAAFPAMGTAIGAKNGANMVNLTADNSNNLNVNVAVSALPTGAATSALQTTGNTALGTINTTLGSPFQVGGSIGNTSFIANAGTNLNTSLLALESGGNLAGLVTQIGAVTTSPTANTVNDRLKTINTTLGSPFQAGGNIGNTTFAVTNAGTFVTQATLAAETTKVIGTVNQGTSPWVTSGTSTVSGTVSATQGTSPWIVAGGGTAGTAATSVATVQGIASMTPVQVSQATAANLNATIVGTGTLATQSAITAASSSIASGAVASGAFASGALSSGSISNGADVAEGSTTDTASTATDTTAATQTAILKEISKMEQTPASRAVTNAGTFAVTQATGTNLHAVLDTTSTTAVTQATGTNLHAVLDTTSTTAVTQATGTNLHAVLDATSTSDLSLAQASTTSGQKGGLGQGAVTTASPTYVTAQTDPLSMDVHGGTRMLIQDTTGTPVDYTTAVLVTPSSDYPSGATAETATSGLVSNTSAVATLATAGGKTTYITGFECTPGSATAGAVVSIVVSGTVSGSMTYDAYATNATTFVPAPTATSVQFSRPIPASATNTTIVVTMGAVGTGGATAVCNAHGYQL